MNVCISKDIKIILSGVGRKQTKYNYISNIIINTNISKYYKNYDKHNIAFIFYTTGTTGPRKGVMLSHANLIASTKNINEFMKIDSSAVESLPMRLSHSFGLQG